MRKIAFLGAVAVAALAVPAQANEARVEARGGIAWSAGEEEAVLGAAAGYDFDLGETTFFGVEATADKILTDGADVSFGFNGRFGVKVGAGTKLYASAGYQTEPCDLCSDAWSLGAGAELPISDKIYAKAEYRHFFNDDNYYDANAAVVGLGIKF